MVRTDRQGWTAALGVVTAAAMIGTAQSAQALALDGVADNNTDSHGTYYIVTGGLFQSDDLPNGTRASGEYSMRASSRVTSQSAGCVCRMYLS